MFQRTKNFLFKRTIADGIGLLGILSYFLLSFILAHTTRPILDEGLYTYKGWLFVSGRYTPYQDYGPWMNHMPFSFLIPGVIQELFGPGLRAGRYFSIFCGLAMIFGLYLTARRLGSRWTAAAVVWAFVLNFSTIQTYSVSISQGLVACVLTWLLFLSLGDDRPLWQILVAVFLSAILFMIRINMFPIFVLLLFYLWWEHGWSKARWALLVALLSFVGFHALFWPGILQHWLRWLPVSLNWEATSSFIPSSDLALDETIQISYAHVDSLFFTVRSHFIAIAGAIAAWLLWPNRNQWEKQTYYRIAVFLSVTFTVMFLAHAWASLGKNYCVSCLPVYTSFFQILGILLVVVSLKFWRKGARLANQILAIFFIIVVFAGAANSLNEAIDIRPDETIQSVLLLSQNAGQFPNSVKGQVLNFISNIFTVQNEKEIISLSKRLSLSYYGVLAGSLFVLLVGVIWYAQRRFSKNPMSFGSAALYLFLVLGFLLLPSKIMLNDQSFQCREDQISNFEKLGKEIADKIPEDSQIYWLGYSPSLLLYLPDVKIFPPQLNGYNTFSTLLNSDELYREGRWNEELAERWAGDATHMILTQLAYQSSDRVIENYVKTGVYREISLDTTFFYTCDETNQLKIRLFERIE